AGEAEPVPNAAYIDEPLHPRAYQISLPWRNQNCADFDEPRAQAFDAANASCVFVKTGGDSNSVTESKSAPGEGIRQQLWREAQRQPQQRQAGGMSEFGWQEFNNRPEMAVAQHADRIRTENAACANARRENVGASGTQFAIGGFSGRRSSRLF